MAAGGNIMSGRRWSEERHPWDAQRYRRGGDERGDWSGSEPYPDVGESERHFEPRFRGESQEYGYDTSGRDYGSGYGANQGTSYPTRYGGGYGRDFGDRYRNDQGRRYGVGRGGGYGRDYGSEDYGQSGEYGRGSGSGYRGDYGRHYRPGARGDYARSYGSGYGADAPRRYGSASGGDLGRGFGYGVERDRDHQYSGAARTAGPSGHDRGYGRFGSERDAGSSQGAYGDDSRHYGSRSDPRQRNWRNRPTDEVRSWMGDDQAERRRRIEALREPRRWRGPRGYRRSDERILEDVSDRLGADWNMDAMDIEVSVVNAEVTLNGTVESRWGKRRAEDIADSVLGVTHVQNNLRVRDRSDSPAGAQQAAASSGEPRPGAASAATQSTGVGTSSSSVGSTPSGAGSTSSLGTTSPTDPRARH
jgi:osmotically-inducible protein OsmY